MTFLRKLSDIVFPKRYPSAWARQKDEHQNRWQEHRIAVLKKQCIEFANRKRTGAAVM